MAIHHAIGLRQTFVVFPEERFFRYLRGGDLRRLRVALEYLIAAPVHVGVRLKGEIEDICRRTSQLISANRQGGMIVVDNLHGFRDMQGNVLSCETVLVRLGKLARELGVPVIAVYPLEQEPRGLLLTKDELYTVKYLASCVDETLIVWRTEHVLRFEKPTIPSWVKA